MVIMAPKDGDELRHMLYSAYLYERPVVYPLPRGEARAIRSQIDLTKYLLAAWERLRMERTSLL
jgi:1-deoxy-D-xylulose-5-phosphate synthase